MSSSNKKTIETPVLKCKQCSETNNREDNVRPKIDLTVPKNNQVKRASEDFQKMNVDENSGVGIHYDSTTPYAIKIIRSYTNPG